MLSVVEGLFSDNRKIGIILLSFGIALLFMGIILLFDPVLLAMGNVLFIGSMPFIFGFLRSLRFFNPFEYSSKWKGVVSFLGGMVLVMIRWPICGMIVEVYGIVRLFGSYFPMLLSMFKQIPGIGSFIGRIPYLKELVNSASKQSSRYPDV